MQATDFCEKFKEKFGTQILEEKEFRGEKTLVIEKEAILSICTWAKETLGFDYLIDISSVDHMGEDPRFELVYELYSMKDGVHLRLKAGVGEDTPAADSVSAVWPTANWHEREIWDLMGIRFTNHPDLRRIIMWEGYPYHPLRKDFPLAGLPSEMPDVAFTGEAPLAGGPFVTTPTDGNTQVREPRAREATEPSAPKKFISEP